MQKWSNYKNDVVMSVKANQLNERKTFDQQLRHPQKIPMKSHDPAYKGVVMRDGIKEKYLVNKEEIKIKELEKVMPNYLQTTDYYIHTKKQKNEEI